MSAQDQHVIWERRQSELWDRIFQVTQDVVTLAEAVEDVAGGRVLKEEVMKTAMNVGRFVVRATAADEARDFLHNLNEARLAAIETDYWLRLAYILQQREDVQQDVSSIINQYSAVIDLLQKLVRHAAGEPNVVNRHTRGPRVS